MFFGLIFVVQKDRSQEIRARWSSCNEIPSTEASSRQLWVVVVPLTKQTKHADIPGNVLLQKEGGVNLPRESLARCTHVMVIDKSRLGEKAGTLTKKRRQDILNHLIWVLGQGKVPA